MISDVKQWVTRTFGNTIYSTIFNLTQLLSGYGSLSTCTDLRSLTTLNALIVNQQLMIQNTPFSDATDSRDRGGYRLKHGIKYSREIHGTE